MDKIEKVLAPFANALNNNKIIQTISKALMSLMPALMIGAIGSLLQQIPIPAYQNFIQSTGIYAFTQVLVNVTTNMLALYAAFAISYVFVKNEGHDGFTGGILSLIAFMIVTPMETVGEGWAAVTNLPLSWLGAKGLFTAMFVALLTGYIYSFLMRKNITIKMPDSVPPFVSKSFSGIIPGAAIALIFGIISILIQMTPFGDVHQAIYGLIGAPLSSIGGSIWAALLIYVLSGFCWFFGIHGIAVMSAVMPIWMAADMANVSAISAGGAASNIVTYNWVNAIGNIGGAGCTLGLILLCAFAAKSKRYREMGKLAIVPSCFGINEPVVFGLPCMLNATLMIPFVFLPVILIGISYILTITGILPIGNGIAAGACIPVFSGLLIGGWRVALWNIIEILITVLAYLPFFKILDKQAYLEENPSTEN
ncbi:MAG: PTS transporter subunit EIIC [Longibaculum muris]|uniref:Permease IIC component n=1 Tax=Longibaculum muris TaxID=1796628 RepID=A0A4R3Z6I5_9FIRM|nr:PTS transporter subunit EIIC [Longibaculum muris]KXU48883.1 putative PTS system, cellobiose-specific IIC component [Candidatus Stoquefichus sp. KLE1796]MBS5370345.1 PTS sugar transporter subunit IIC [Coprobacillus cateniformis]MCR1886769.1 PTS transporter subunit EIIC [Longibaculum muris]MED9810571.1 PTS transporter subunit EIIC [Longibaculum muris]TCW02798.1 PTS system cellobiose-specific IIC component [Longibaculum muris]